MPIETSREGAPQIYVPTLHKELVRHTVPEAVLFFAPGLPQQSGMPGFFTPANYPLEKEEASQALADLLAIGEALDVATPTGSQTARERMAEDADLDKKEKADLAHFASGKPAPAPAPAGGTAHIAAQKVLLLAWDLEERLVELDSLRQEVAAAAKPLAANLHGPDAEAYPTGTDANFTVSDAPEDADWRMVLTAMAAFLPPDAVLVTGHTAMREALLEAGMLHPLPEDVARSLHDWPETMKSSMLWAKVPLWRVLGYAREPESAPWLLATPEILVCSDKGLI